MAMIIPIIIIIITTIRGTERERGSRGGGEVDETRHSRGWAKESGGGRCSGFIHTPT